MLTPDSCDSSPVLKDISHIIFYVTLAPVLGLEQKAMISTVKEQKPVLSDLTKVSVLMSTGVGMYTQVFHSQVQHLRFKTNKMDAVTVWHSHLFFLES